ncbi:MAG: isopentenyl-diphosphate delta-isomerase [Legionellales bacterium]|nr:isopentenyl-diphosphate delta-isomerase [Legionellales bacterium]|tara:strand:- start:8 stop:547 length:540 start_codon:yes stop_codon:yes gene_type:complete
MTDIKTREPNVILVDSNDQPVGIAGKLEAHQKNWCHRAFSICLTRNEGSEILLQQRHPDKYHCGSLWSNACCSHPAPGDHLATSARKRLKFEMGIDHKQLQHIGAFYYQATLSDTLSEHEFDHVFHGVFEPDDCLFNKTEVIAIQWIHRSDLDRALQTHPEHYTPWLPQLLALLYQNIN